MQKVEVLQGSCGMLRLMLAETGQSLQDPHMLEVLGGILDYCTYKPQVGAEFRDFLLSVDAGLPGMDAEQAGRRFRLWLYERNVAYAELKDSHFACFGDVALFLKAHASVRDMVTNILERITEQAGHGALQYTGLRH